MSLDFYLSHQRSNRELFERNITHNLTKMAGEAGIYKVLWRPDENGYSQAKQIVPALQQGLEKLRANPDHYEQFEAENGWGTYDGLVEFTEAVLEACLDFPEARILVSR